MKILERLGNRSPREQASAPDSAEASSADEQRLLMPATTRSMASS